MQELAFYSLAECSGYDSEFARISMTKTTENNSCSTKQMNIVRIWSLPYQTIRYNIVFFHENLSLINTYGLNFQKKQIILPSILLT